MSRTPLRFALSFLALLVVLTVLARSPWVLRELRDPLCTALAQTVSSVLAPLGIETRVAGSTVIGTTGAIEIVYDCDGVGLLIFFLSASVAFPIRRTRDLLPGIAWGFLVISCANVLRLSTLTWLILRHRELFEFVHTHVFQGFLIVVTVVAWATWVTWAQRAEPETT